MCMEIKDLNASQQEIADIWKVFLCVVYFTFQLKLILTLTRSFFQNTQNNSVEQHRLKCSIGLNVNLSGNSNIVADISKNSNNLNNGGAVDIDRQWIHVSNSVRQNRSYQLMNYDTNYSLIIQGITTHGNNATTRNAYQIQSEASVDHSTRILIAINSNCVYS